MNANAALWSRLRVEINKSEPIRIFDVDLTADWNWIGALGDSISLSLSLSAYSPLISYLLWALKIMIFIIVNRSVQSEAHTKTITERWMGTKVELARSRAAAAAVHLRGSI